MNAIVPLSTESDWTFELLQQYENEIARIAEDFQLDTYPNQIEIISSEQMMDAYASSAMPISYHHWSFGKQFLSVQNSYRRGHMGLAYEIVFNSNPCIAYLMEENTLTMQALVIAHASYGHNSFFKNNYMFRTWTDAGSIIDYMLFARKFIADCEQRHGVGEEVAGQHHDIDDGLGIRPGFEQLVVLEEGIVAVAGVSNDQRLHGQGVLLHQVGDAGVGVENDLIGKAHATPAVVALHAEEVLAEGPVMVVDRHG